MIKYFNPKLILSGISRRNSRFASGTIFTLFISVLFEISKTRFLGTLSDCLLIKIARVRQNDNFTFAVGLELYTKGQHQKANDLFGVISNFGNLTQRALYLIALCASWQMNLSILKRIKLESNCETLKLFLNGLILHDSSLEASIESFMRVHESYLWEHPEKNKFNSLPEYVRNSINVSRPILQSPVSASQNNLLRHLQYEKASLAELQLDSSDLILISYTSSYLFALSDLVIGRIRKNNNTSVLLIITISEMEDTSALFNFCRKLSEDYGKVFWSIIVSSFDLPVLSSVIRLVIAQELFEMHEINSILVLDGDTSFKHVDPVRVWTSIRRNFDIALLQNRSLCPWERMSLGFSVLNNSENTKKFLSNFDSYVTKHLIDGRAFWTLDQTAVFMVLHELEMSGRGIGTVGIEILDLSALVSLDDFIFTDKLLATLKLKAKMSNRDFIAGMSEDLYLP